VKIKTMNTKIGRCISGSDLSGDTIFPHSEGEGISE